MSSRWDTWTWRTRLGVGSTMNRRTSRRLHIYRGLCAWSAMNMLMWMMMNMGAWRRRKGAMLDGEWCSR